MKKLEILGYLKYISDEQGIFTEPAQDQICFHTGCKSPKTYRSNRDEFIQQGILKPIGKKKYQIVDLKPELPQVEEIKLKEQTPICERVGICGGIYGIYYQNMLIYIGKTRNDFKIRWEHHRDGFKKGEGSKLYTSGLKVEDLEFKILFDVKT